MNSSSLVIRNRQRIHRVDLHALRRILSHLVQKELGLQQVELGVRLVDDAEMTRANEHYLGHQGSTDVISFGYEDHPQTSHLTGDLLVCVPEAVRQAKRFRVQWEHELVRYLVHGVLHLRGYEDGTRRAREKMKREENRLMRNLRSHIPSPGRK